MNDRLRDTKGSQVRTSVTTVGGVLPKGADVLRERLRWAAAERRWSPSFRLPCPPATPPVGRGVLPCGAQLTRYTEAPAARR